jgi:sterol 3beta-glucosyltransferase
MDFSETIEVKVFDKGEHLSVDSYFFAYFHDLPGALDQIRDAVRAHRALPERGLPHLVLDTTVSRPMHNIVDRTQSMPTPNSHSKSASGFSLTSFLRPFQETISLGRPSAGSLPESLPGAEEFTHISRRPNSSFMPITVSPIADPHHVQEDSSKSLTPTPSSIDHTYPPSTSISSYDPDHPSLTRESSSAGSVWSVGVPSWLKGSRRVFSGLESATSMPVSPPGVREVYSSTTSTPSNRLSGMGDMAFSVLETPDMIVDAEMTEKFRNAFAYDEKETLLGCSLFSHLFFWRAKTS